jgi:hypothetical protein
MWVAVTSTGSLEISWENMVDIQLLYCEYQVDLDSDDVATRINDILGTTERMNILLSKPRISQIFKEQEFQQNYIFQHPSLCGFWYSEQDA